MKSAYLAVLVAALSACAANPQMLPFDARFYEGSPRPQSEIAVLQYGHGMLAGKNVLPTLWSGPGVSWNGTQAIFTPPAAPARTEKVILAGNLRNIELLPGRYGLGLRYFEEAGYASFAGEFAASLSFNAQAGHTYKLEARREGGGTWTATLTDVGTGEVFTSVPTSIRTGAQVIGR